MLESLTWAEWLKIIPTAEAIGVDTETTGADGIRDGRHYAVGVSLAARIPGMGVVSRYMPIRHGDNGDVTHEDRTQLKETLENYTGRVFFHNAKFDLVSLRTLGIDYSGHFVDTMLLAHLVNENTPAAKSLDSCTKYYLKDEGKKKSAEFEGWIKAYGWGNVPSALMSEYAAYDADLTLRLGEHLVNLAGRENLLDYWPHKERFVRLIVMMESYGIKIDTELSKRMVAHGESEMGELLDILGYDKLGPIALKELLIERLGLPPIYKVDPKTKETTDRLTFDKKAMERYEELLSRTDDPTAEYVLRYRGWQKTTSSNYRPYLDLLSPDGRLRPNYKLHGTRTGRMSCERPNLQQIPRVSDKPWNGELKSAFIAEEGFTLWDADYSQLELRLGTAYGNEEGLKTVFREGRDIFTEMSQELGMDRQGTKTMTYTIQYGGGIRRLMEVFGVTENRARYLLDNFYKTYPGFRRVSNNAKREVVGKGKVRLWSGRYRHFYYGADEAHKAFNAVMQGGAADIMERSMLRVADSIGWYNPDCRMLLQVHDSIVFEIKDGMEAHYHPLIQAAMERVEPDFGVRFQVKIKKWGSD